MTSCAASRKAHGANSSGTPSLSLKRYLAKRFHPDYALGQGIEKTVRNEVFKEIWSEIERARSRNLDPPLCDGTIILRRIGPTSHRDGTDLRQAKGLRRSKLERRATAFLPPDRIIASFGSTLSRGAKLSHGKTVSGKAKGRPPQEGRHPRCRLRAGLTRHRLDPPHCTRAAPASTHTVHTAPEESWHRSNPNLDNPP
jgi:hypothetical protein